MKIYILLILILWELLLEDAYTDPHFDAPLFTFKL